MGWHIVKSNSFMNEFQFRCNVYVKLTNVKNFHLDSKLQAHRPCTYYNN